MNTPKARIVQYPVQYMLPMSKETNMVQAVSYSAFRNNLKSYMRKVNEDADMLLITNTNPDDNVVVMSVADYESLMETLYVHQNQYLRDKVLRGLRQAREGHVTQHTLITPDNDTDNEADSVASSDTAQLTPSIGQEALR